MGGIMESTNSRKEKGRNTFLLFVWKNCFRDANINSGNDEKTTYVRYVELYCLVGLRGESKDFG